MTHFPVTALRSVELETPDLARSEAFYIDVWGLELVTRTGGVTYLRATGADHHVVALRQGDGPALRAIDFRLNSAAEFERVAAAWRACGAIIHRLTPQEHDKVFAAVSHLPHLLAFALVDDIAAKPHADLLFQYAASGFRDFTRIAGSSPEMWRDISLANRDALLVELDAYLAQLSTMRAMLAAGDGAALEGVYANAQRARCAWIEAIESTESGTQT